MIQDVKNRPISELFDVDSRVVYVVPKYQREYTWRKPEWEALLDDLLENSPGYFLGSLICINQAKDALGVQELEVVDGQQRLVTLSLLFAAICRRLQACKGALDEDQTVDLVNLRRKLVLKNSDDQIRVVPQIQNDNQSDYRAVLADVGVIGPHEARRYAGNGRIFRAFRYFNNRIEDMTKDQEHSIAVIMGLLERVNRTCLVKIEVASHADAYTLFESLNNRGVPLTAIDLIKNKLLARMDRLDPNRIDRYSSRWSQLLIDLGDDYAVQERFLRHYYNAFKYELNLPFRTTSDRRQEPLGPVATRSNLIKIFEQIIDHDAPGFFDRLSTASQLYALILTRCEDESFSDLGKPLKDLERIQGAPSYLLMLHLLVHRDELGLFNQHLRQVVDLMVRFFVRRNLTDTPPTRDLTRMFMGVIDDLPGARADAVVDVVRKHLRSHSASDEAFQRNLEGKVYEENYGVTRFILSALAEKGMTRESWVDLWRVENRQSVWTVEHVFPQGESIPESWVEMIADGDESKAREYQETHVHKLGNLTISGYNSSLGNASFEAKRDRTDRQGRFVGYRNGLMLNEGLANASKWTIEQIDRRTAKLVEAALEAFRMDP